MIHLCPCTLCMRGFFRPLHHSVLVAPNHITSFKWWKRCCLEEMLINGPCSSMYSMYESFQTFLEVTIYTSQCSCCSLTYSAGLQLIDWKTSTHKKTKLSQTFDHPLQLAAYVGLWNSVHQHKQVRRKIRGRSRCLRIDI